MLFFIKFLIQKLTNNYFQKFYHFYIFYIYAIAFAVDVVCG